MTTFLSACPRPRVPRILVVGDAILDRYYHGEYTKPNPETSGRVLRVRQVDDRPGGAAAVAAIAAGLGAEVTLATVLGDDDDGRQLVRLIWDAGVRLQLWRDPTRPTTRKDRTVVGEPGASAPGSFGHLLPDRLDYECDRPIPKLISAEMADLSVAWDAIAIQDYGKGVCTLRVLRSLISRAACPVLVDPYRALDWRCYAGCRVLKCNLSEAHAQIPRDHGGPAELAATLSARLACSVVLTLGSDGLVCHDRGLAAGIQQAAPPVAVRDVCGAGDTVLASLAVDLARGVTLLDALEPAQRRAAQQVSHLGISRVSA